MHIAVVLLAALTLGISLPAQAQAPRTVPQRPTTPPDATGPLYQKAVALRDGTDGPVDLGRAFTAFEEAAKAGNVGALYEVGVAYEYGLGVAQNVLTALNTYQAAARYPYARDRAALLSHLMWTPRDKRDPTVLRNLQSQAPDLIEDAFAWVRGLDRPQQPIATAKSGHPYAKRGRAILEAIASRGVVPRSQQGSRVQAGHAQFLLALMYKDGHGVDKDPAQSLKWLETAAANGYKPARLRAADHILTVKRDRAQARKLLEALDEELASSSDPADKGLRDLTGRLLERAGGVSRATQAAKAREDAIEAALAKRVEPRIPLCAGVPCSDLRFGTERRCLTLINNAARPVEAAITLQLNMGLKLRLEPKASQVIGEMRFTRRSDGTIEPTYECAEQNGDVVSIDASFGTAEKPGRP